MEQIQEFTYEGQAIEFDLSSPNLMVNATGMAQIFGKKTNDFLRLDQTKAFIQECLSYGNSRNSDEAKSENSRFLGIANQEDLVNVNHRHGTWMHRILALKFAAWLDPAFELWVYCTIDELMFGKTRERLKQKARIDARVVKLKDELFRSNRELMEEITKLETQSRALASENTRSVKSQYRLFRSESLNDEFGDVEPQHIDE